MRGIRAPQAQFWAFSGVFGRFRAFSGVFGYFWGILDVWERFGAEYREEGYSGGIRSERGFPGIPRDSEVPCQESPRPGTPWLAGRSVDKVARLAPPSGICRSS